MPPNFKVGKTKATDTLPAKQKVRNQKKRKIQINIEVRGCGGGSTKLRPTLGHQHGRLQVLQYTFPLRYRKTSFLLRHKLRRLEQITTETVTGPMRDPRQHATKMHSILSFRGMYKENGYYLACGHAWVTASTVY